MDNTNVDIELLMARVELMRTAQRDYFARRMQADKKLAIALENEVDGLLRQLRKKGYNPDLYKVKSEQKNLF